MHWIFVLVTFLTFPTTQSNPLTKAENENRLSTCGKNSKTKVYNGREVDRIEAPWTVYLKMENVTETGSMKSVSSTVCSGTVISPRHILTATHCFARLDEKIGLSGLKNGVLDRKKCDKDHYHIADPYILGNTYIMGDDVEQLDKYPEKVTLVNGCMSKELKKEIAMVQIDDFAIIHLSKELSFSDRVQQACVSNSETDHKPEMTLDYYGFGIKQFSLATVIMLLLRASDITLGSLYDVNRFEL
uniref:Peptidase S1 domain-containing protein n=1 Tax=Caenorhabditis japonica TaxID=281687 RepID=A0A8R1EAK2_CAEJA